MRPESKKEKLTKEPNEKPEKPEKHYKRKNWKPTHQRKPSSEGQQD